MTEAGSRVHVPLCRSNNQSGIAIPRHGCGLYVVSVCIAYRPEPTAPVTEASTVPAVLAAVLLPALTVLPAVVAAPVTAALAVLPTLATVLTALAAVVPAVLAAVPAVLAGAWLVAAAGSLA